MGNWGTGPFDNDEALDWVIDLSSDDTAEAIRTPLLIAAAADALEPWQSQHAVAAAAVVAAARTREAENLPPEVEDWLRAHRDLIDGPATVLALRALAVVIAAEAERDLWLKPEDGIAWRSGVERLVAALSMNQQ